MFHEKTTQLFKSCLVKTRNQVRDDSQGFSLIEVLIAITIFSIGLLAVASMQSTSIDSSSSAMVQTEVAAWAADRVESLMAIPYHDSALDAGTYGSAVSQSSDGIDNDWDGAIDEAGETGSLNTITWTIQEDTPINNTKTITVTVTSTREGGKTVTLEMTKVDII
jgi:type IV pilus assembly protein PilV